MKIGIVELPGYDRNLQRVMESHFHNSISLISMVNPSLDTFDLVVLPSNELYSQSDDLRQRVLASKLPQALKIFSKQKGFIVGIQSGVDILCRAKLLPGYFVKDDEIDFINGMVNVVVESRRSPLTYFLDFDKPLKLFLSHSLGGYKLSSEDLRNMKMRGQVLLRYCNDEGVITKEACIDRSIECIAAISNRERNVFGIIPNPSVSSLYHNKLDGLELIESFLKMITR